jgi:hypothetical protein
VRTPLRFEWRAGAYPRFRSGVSLHSHTLHSREGLGFLYGLADKFSYVRDVLRRGEGTYREVYGSELDLHRGWWTPPLGPLEAFTLEREQIESRGCNALVSISDHDNIEAPELLQLLEECHNLPVSVEWTVPYRSTYFHLGVHNLPKGRAVRFMDALSSHTQAPQPGELGDLLSQLHGTKDVLVVFNHPLWDETGVGKRVHQRLARAFLREYGQFVHALEFNGLRPWRENQGAIKLAEAAGKPVISGGDRHGFEPNAVLNLTNSTSFAEFVAEVRTGQSEVLVTSHYREPHTIRILRNVADIMANHAGHFHGWKSWCDRVFYRFEDGRVQSVAQAFGGMPALLRPVSLAMSLLQRRPLLGAIRWAIARQPEVAL